MPNTTMSTENNRVNLVDSLVPQNDNNWQNVIDYTIINNHKELIDFFISKGADNWQNVTDYTTINNHKELIDFFISKGADTPYIVRKEWCIDNLKYTCKHVSNEEFRELILHCDSIYSNKCTIDISHLSKNEKEIIANYLIGYSYIDYNIHDIMDGLLNIIGK